MSQQTCLHNLNGGAEEVFKPGRVKASCAVVQHRRNHDLHPAEPCQRRDPRARVRSLLLSSAGRAGQRQCKCPGSGGARTEGGPAGADLGADGGAASSASASQCERGLATGCSAAGR